MKSDQRVVITKRLLKEGLIRLLEKKDIDEIKIKELCEESGVNRATFYRHYDLPIDILREIKLDLFEEIRKKTDKKIAQKNLLVWLTNMCQCFYDNADIIIILSKTKTDDEFVKTINEIYENNIPTEIKAGSFDDNSLRLRTYYYAGGIYYVIRQWLCDSIEKSPEEIAELLYQFILKK